MTIKFKRITKFEKSIGKIYKYIKFILILTYIPDSCTYKSQTRSRQPEAEQEELWTSANQNTLFVPAHLIPDTFHVFLISIHYKKI